MNPVYGKGDATDDNSPSPESSPLVWLHILWGLSAFVFLRFLWSCIHLDKLQVGIPFTGSLIPNIEDWSKCVRLAVSGLFVTYLYTAWLLGCVDRRLIQEAIKLAASWRGEEAWSASERLLACYLSFVLVHQDCASLPLLNIRISNHHCVVYRWLLTHCGQVSFWDSLIELLESILKTISVKQSCDISNGNHGECLYLNCSPLEAVTVQLAWSARKCQARCFPHETWLSMKLNFRIQHFKPLNIKWHHLCNRMYRQASTSSWYIP